MLFAGCDAPGSCSGSQVSNSNVCDSRHSNPGASGVKSTPNLIDTEDLRRKRLAYLEANARRNTSAATGSNENMKKQVNT